MRKWIVRFLILLGVVGLIVILKLTLLAPDPVPVSVFRVERGSVESTVTNSKAGTVKTRQRAKLTPEISGRIIELPYRKGAKVKKDDVLVRLDDSSLQAQLRLRERELSEAKAVRDQHCLIFDRSERELSRNQDLATKGIISPDLLDHFQSAYDTAKAACRAASVRVERAQSAINVTQTELEKTAMRAPFDGVVAELSIEIGEWSSPSPPGIFMPSVLELINADSIYIAAPMDEVDSARIKTGQQVRITLDPFPGESFPGKVSRVAPYVLDLEQQNRTVEIEVQFEDTDFASTLLPGTSADVEVVQSAHHDVLRIPTAALLEDDKVLVFEENRLNTRPIEIGLKNWNFTEVTKGLKEGDPVVTSLDRVEVKEGVKVVLEEEEPRNP